MGCSSGNVTDERVVAEKKDNGPAYYRDFRHNHRILHGSFYTDY